MAKAKSKKAKFQTEVFNPGLPVFVRREFRGSGRPWSIGDSFDWQTLSISQRRVSQLFQQRFLTHEQAEAEKPKAAPKPKAKEEVKTDDTPKDGQADDKENSDAGQKTEDKTPPKTVKAKVKSKGNGWYNVIDQDGNILNSKGLRKPEAEAYLKDLLNKK